MARKKIGLYRWQQIDRYLHISKPSPDGATPFEKLSPLSEHLRQRFKLFWKVGTHLAVDETLQRFTGRSHEIVNISSKPTPEGFKIWVLADAGYVLDWIYHAKGDKHGPVGLDKQWTKQHGFSKTQGVVLQLVSQEGIRRDFQHIIWLDNLFTSARLLTELKKRGFGAAGTVRTTKTERERKEEKKGTTAQKKQLQREKGRGLNPSLTELRSTWNAVLEWGTLYSKLSEDGEVMEFAWKDQNVVLFMTTIHTGKETVIKSRRRPAETSTNAKTSRAPFGDQAVKDMPIPEFIDMYNHHMNGVDQADQLRSYYNTQRTHNKTWKPLWHFLLDTAVSNAYKIAHSLGGKPYGGKNVASHKAFRIDLARELFNHSERL